MLRVGWSLPAVVSREIAGAWRAILGLLLAALGLVALPVATATVMDRVSPAAGSPSARLADDSPTWVPTARGPRTARTTITVDAIRTGTRVAVEHVIELTDGDLLYEAVLSGIIPADEVLGAVIGEVEVRLGDSEETLSHDRFTFDRVVGASPRITSVASRDFPEGRFRTSTPGIALTPPADRRAAAPSSTVTVRGVGYALDAVLAGEPDTAQAAGATFTDPPSQVDVLMVRTAAAAVSRYRTGTSTRPPCRP